MAKHRRKTKRSKSKVSKSKASKRKVSKFKANRSRPSQSKKPKSRPSKSRPSTPNISLPGKLATEITRLQDGDTAKANPFFILVVNNIALETPIGSNQFVADMSNPSLKGLFSKTVGYIKKNLFGQLPGQAENLLADSPDHSKIKFWSAWISGAGPSAATSLVGEDSAPLSQYLLPRRDAVPPLLRSIGLDPDIIFVLSTKSTTHTFAHSFAATDDQSRGGVAAEYDGGTITHRFYSTIPGMTALHTSNGGMDAAHEFGHAISSYQNGRIVDLYLPNTTAFFNCKVGRPIPNQFATYQRMGYLTDKARSALGGYHDVGESYHPELMDPSLPALMDNYREATKPMSCRHDKITKAYIMDKIAARVSR